MKPGFLPKYKTMAPARRSKRRWRAALIVLLAAVLCSAAFSPAVAENNGSVGAHVHTSACKRQTGARIQMRV